MAIDFNQFRRDLTYSVTAPIPEVLSDLQAIARFSQEVRVKKKQFNTLLFVALLGIVLSIFFIHSPISVVVLVGSILGVIYAGVMLRRYGQTDIPDYREQTLVKLVELVDRDLTPGEPIQVNSVFSSPHQSNKRTQTLPHPQRPDWKIEYFTDPWLKLEGRFLDQTHFRLVCTEQAITQAGWKRGRSGKSKYKKKSKSKRTDLELTLTRSRHKYGTLARLQQEARGAIKLPSSVRVKRFKITDNRLYLKTSIPVAASSSLRDDLYQTATMMFLSLYQVLNLAHLRDWKSENPH